LFFVIDTLFTFLASRLPISKRIDFKIAYKLNNTLTYKLLGTQQPTYLRSVIQFHTSSPQTRSSELSQLHHATTCPHSAAYVPLVLYHILCLMPFLSQQGLLLRFAHSSDNLKHSSFHLSHSVTKSPIPSTATPRASNSSILLDHGTLLIYEYYFFIILLTFLKESPWYEDESVHILTNMCKFLSYTFYYESTVLHYHVFSSYRNYLRKQQTACRFVYII
jgi:hypothetical protein